MDEALLIFYVRPARRKAMACATAEAMCLLHDLRATAPGGGPLSDRGGLFRISLPGSFLEQSRTRLPRLGYTCAVDWLEPVQGSIGSDRKASSRVVRWRGGSYRLARLYEEDAALLRDRAPDRRLFALGAKDDQPRLIRGYRGDSGALSRRALAVYDARMLLNLVHDKEGAVFLDPFAGVGGIVLEAIESGYCVMSSDTDPILHAGLERLGSIHHVADACHLPFDAETIDIIATEPPFDRQATRIVLGSLAEMYRVLKPTGRLAMLCAARQAESLRKQAVALGFTLWLDSALDRKGMDCCVLVWQKD